MNRRQLLIQGSTLGAAIAMGTSLSLMAQGSKLAGSSSPSRKRMLFLGGTGFIGPPMVRYALERGHEVTIFTRGKTTADLPDVEHLIGDRTGDLEALKGRNWDVVLDNNARDYRWVELTTELLKDKVEHYLFVSSVSAYAGEAVGYEFLDQPYQGPQTTIDSPLATIPSDFQPGQELEYGPTKVMSEKLTMAAFPGRSTIVRPGYIVGPGDPTDRFTYWPVRIEKGGEVLCPGDGTDLVQVIDVRDLVEWIVRLAETDQYGVFNGVGLATPFSMAEMIYGIRAVTTRATEFTWVPSGFLRDQEVQPYSDMPIWIPGDPLNAVDNSHAVSSGLTYRPLAVTVADTLEWHRSRPEEAQLKLRAGLDPEREQAVLKTWREARSS